MVFVVLNPLSCYVWAMWREKVNSVVQWGIKRELFLPIGAVFVLLAAATMSYFMGPLDRSSAEVLVVVGLAMTILAALPWES